LAPFAVNFSIQFSRPLSTITNDWTTRGELLVVCFCFAKWTELARLFTTIKTAFFASCNYSHVNSEKLTATAASGDSATSTATAKYRSKGSDSWQTSRMNELPTDWLTEWRSIGRCWDWDTDTYTDTDLDSDSDWDWAMSGPNCFWREDAAKN